jgi:hypothetical protein
MKIKFKVLWIVILMAITVFSFTSYGDAGDIQEPVALRYGTSNRKR